MQSSGLCNEKLFAHAKPCESWGYLKILEHTIIIINRYLYLQHSWAVSTDYFVVLYVSFISNLLYTILLLKV